MGPSCHAAKRRVPKAFWVALVLLEAALMSLLIWRPQVEFAISPNEIRKEGSLSYIAAVPPVARFGFRLLADSNDRPAQSNLVVLRDGQPLGPPHTSHDQIRTNGHGAFSHWGNVVYFSTPDNLDPRSDAHTYTLRARLDLAPGALAFLVASAIVVLLVLLFGAVLFFKQFFKQRSALGKWSRPVWSRAARQRWDRVVAQGCIALLAAGCCASVFLAVWRPTLEAALRADRIAHVAGNGYSTPVPDNAVGYQLLGDTNDRPRQSTVTLLRDGRPIGPAHVAHDVINASGNGAFSHWGGTLFFSTPGNTDPRNDGHTYRLRGQLSPTPLLSALLWAVAVVTGSALLVVLRRRLRNRTSHIIVLSKVVGLGVLGALAPWMWVPPVATEAQRLGTAGRYVLLCIFVGAAASAFAGMLLTPFLRDGRLRSILTVVLLVGFGADQVMLAISNYPMTLDMMTTLWRERAMAGGVVFAYDNALINAGAVMVLVAAPFMLTPPARWALSSRFAAVPFLAILSVAAILESTRGLTSAFPAPVLVPAELLVASVFPESRYTGERDEVQYSREFMPVIKKIVMIVDESVRGDYLGVNNEKYDNTPFLSTITPLMANYGLATSAANCSVAARLIMRVGLREDQLPDTRQVWRRLPSIWQYAHHAGFRTALIDAWRPRGAFHSYMDQQEAREIDTNLSATNVAEPMRDSLAADMLLELLKRDEPLFIYVNKFGTHREYHTTYPPELAYDPSRLVRSLPLDASRRQVVADYHKALWWSVDTFFRKLSPALDRDDTLIIYTSDHGQSLFEGGYDLSHCSLSPSLARGEIIVPLFALTGSSAVRSAFQAAARRGSSRASHFEIFPTLLEAMGYSSEWTQMIYGPSLLRVPVERKRRFVMGTFFDPGAILLDADGER
jgi:glucan phosphoethanolaminetransferase (alkaline phosphatase superfamily)